jgi:hypothetical protein
VSFVPKPQFPNVPQLPGVPQLVRASTAVQTAILPVVNAGIAAARLVAALTSKPKWMIKRSKSAEAPVVVEPEIEEDGVLPEAVVTAPAAPLITPDSFLRIGFNNEWDLPSAPLQGGSFATYNKVNNPFDVILRIVKGGSVEDRTRFLDDLATLGNSLQLVDIVTPERTYLNCNITSVQLVREGGEGAYFFAEVDVSFREIRQVEAQYSTAGQTTATAKNPAALPAVNQGTVQPQTTAERIRGAVNQVRARLATVSNLIGTAN